MPFLGRSQISNSVFWQQRTAASEPGYPRPEREFSSSEKSGREELPPEREELPPERLAAPFVPNPGISDEAEVSVPPNASRRLIWDTRIVLAVLDILFIGLLLGAFLDVVDGRMDFSVSAESPLIFAVGVVSNILLVYACGGYRRGALLNWQLTASRLPVALGLATITLFVVLHFGLASLFPHDALYRSIGRSTIIALISVGISLAATLSARIVFYALVRRGVFLRRVLVVGAGRRAQHLYEAFHGSHRLALELIFVSGEIVGGAEQNVLAKADGPVIAAESRQSLDALANDLLVDEIVVALDHRHEVALERLLACKLQGIRITDVQSFIERETGRVDLASLESTWLLYSDNFGMSRVDLGIKRLLDIVFSLMLLLAALPVLLIAMAAIGLEGHGRVFFRQRRVTRNGRSFWLYKLRTMFADAEKAGPRWAEANDPRVTAVGRILRDTRIDEIPQLFNVLRGDMSLVGPRPERPVFVGQLSREIPLYDLRHTVKTGLTGWAQINYRYGASVADARRKLEYDLHYVKNHHLLLDLSIIVQTFRVLLWGDGAR